MGKVEVSCARVVRAMPDDGIVDACAEIARKLPEHFDESGLKKVGRDLRERESHLADIGGEVTGFAAVERKGEKVAEPSRLAVESELRDRGIGSMPVAYASEALRHAGVDLPEAETLAEEADYPPYEATRRSYEKAGFVRPGTVDPYPGWGPENPCAIPAKAMR